MARTVYCSYCYERGHNRRGCPKRKQEIKDNPEGYEARREARRQEHKKSNPRKCSYCGEPGHTRRTCKALKANIQQFVEDAILWRKTFEAWTSQTGFGVGALVSYGDASFRNREGQWVYGEACTFLVSDLSGEWSGTTHLSMVGTSAPSPFIGVPIWAEIHDRHARTRLDMPQADGISPAEIEGHWGPRDRNVSKRWQVVSPAPTSLPDWWLDKEVMTERAKESFAPKSNFDKAHVAPHALLNDDQRKLLKKAYKNFMSQTE